MVANSRSTPDFPTHLRPSASRLFLLFSYIGISSFGGGVPAWMHHTFVHGRGWIDEREFSTMLALARIVPGVNVVNLAVLIGNRLRGLAGALAAICGLLIGPSLIAISMAILYERISGSAWVPALLSGTAAAAAGLLVAMGLSSIGRAPGSPRKLRPFEPSAISALITFAATFVLVGVLRFPTIPTVLCLAPISIALAFMQRGSRRGASQ
jgi:chromate transporter